MKKREIKESHKFKKQFQTAIKRYKHLPEFEEILDCLENCKEIPKKYKDHPMGKNKFYRNCHLKPDLVLLYRIIEKIVVFERIGSHSSLKIMKGKKKR